jgi:hypothetical protein
MAHAASVVPMNETLPSAPVLVDTQHEDLVHDAQLDYYGCKLATCSSGKLVLWKESAFQLCFVSDGSHCLSSCRRSYHQDLQHLGNVIGTVSHSARS